MSVRSSESFQLSRGRIIPTSGAIPTTDRQLFELGFFFFFLWLVTNGGLEFGWAEMREQDQEGEIFSGSRLMNRHFPKGTVTVIGTRSSLVIFFAVVLFVGAFISTLLLDSSVTVSYLLVTSYYRFTVASFLVQLYY